MLGGTVKFICLYDLHIVIKHTGEQTLSRWPYVASEMTGPSSIMRTFIQLRNEFLFNGFNLFMQSPRLAQFSTNVSAILLSSGARCLPIPRKLMKSTKKSCDN